MKCIDAGLDGRMEIMKGCTYGVGVGPGDPELMTLKAVRILKEADVIVHSGEKPKESTAYQIAIQAVPEIARKEVISITVPMTYDRELQDAEHHRAVSRIKEYLDEGKDIAVLILGDPSVYSSFSYIRTILDRDGYPTATISGVPSFCAAAARLNIPLVEWDEQLHIIPAAHQVHRQERMGNDPAASEQGQLSAPDRIIIQAEQNAQSCQTLQTEDSAQNAQSCQTLQTEDSVQNSQNGLILQAEPPVQRTQINSPSGTCVYMKVGRQMQSLKEELKNTDTEVYTVERCGMEGEHVYQGTEEMPDRTGYFATVIVKHKG